MKNYRQKKLTAVLIILLAVLTISGCVSIAGIDLPALPTPTAEQTPTLTPKLSPSPSPTPAPTVSLYPMPTPTPRPAEDTAVTTETASETSPAPIAAPAPETADPFAAVSGGMSPSPSSSASSSAAAQSPALSISNQTLPMDMQQNNTADLQGLIRTDCGKLTQVQGSLLSSSGDAVQQATYYPNSDSFSFAGTINSELRFAILSPDSYTYLVTASAENSGAVTNATLIEHSFTVYAPSSASGVEYTAKLSEDTDNAALIWNYFAAALGNPYAAAGILGNISTESGCDPMRVEGDISSSGSFSASYTASVDSGQISRDTFVRYTPGSKYGHGYGLCQWSVSRKGLLFDLASERGTSIGNLETQCEFIMQELRTEYPELLEYLLKADDAENAAYEFAQTYEQTAVHGGRTTAAKEYLKKYAA